MTRRSVVLPLPFRPITARARPGSTLRSAPLRTQRRPNRRPIPYSSTAWSAVDTSDSHGRGRLGRGNAAIDYAHPASVRDTANTRDLIGQVDVQSTIVLQVGEQSRQVARVHLARMCRQPRSQVYRTHDVHAVTALV